MPTPLRSIMVLMLAFACASVAQAQTGLMQANAAPIERQDAAPVHHSRPAIQVLRPAPGIIARLSPDGALRTVSTGADMLELRVEHGVANISVYHPLSSGQILIDLPSGQTALLKDGLCTFNAQTNTVRVLRGEAEAFASTAADAKSVKVKEDHQVAFASGPLRPLELAPFQARADLLPSPAGYARTEEPRYAASYGFYGDGYYGDGFGYPYYAIGFGYPYHYLGFGYGFGYGYHGGFGGFGRRFR